MRRQSWALYFFFLKDLENILHSYFKQFLYLASLNMIWEVNKSKRQTQRKKERKKEATMQVLSLSKMCGFEICSLGDVFKNAAHSAERLERVQVGERLWRRVALCFSNTVLKVDRGHFLLKNDVFLEDKAWMAESTSEASCGALHQSFSSLILRI